MSFTIYIDDVDVGDFGNATATCDFSDWAFTLPADEFDRVREFAGCGACGSPVTLRKQLIAAIKLHKPRKAHVVKQATELARMIRASKITDEEGLIVLSDGA